MDTHVVSFYRFTELADVRAFGERVRAAAAARGLLGTAILAPEGLNATLSGGRAALRAMLDWVGAQPGFDGIRGRWSAADEAPFRRLRIKYRDEIVSLGRPDVNPAHGQAEHLDAEAWNALIADPRTLLVDTRNDYEVEVGSFEGATDPGTRNFREFANYIESELAADKQRPIAMYCTGGIRCEKATAVMRRMGFENLYQLDGGILNYLDRVAADPDIENRWRGECFVFDGRVAVDQSLAPGGYVQCHACRRPLSAADLESPLYRPGVSCPACHGTIPPDRARRLEERRRQVELAEARGERHIGAEYPPADD